MDAMHLSDDRFPVRYRPSVGWEVLFDNKRWFVCEDEAEARDISCAPALIKDLSSPTTDHSQLTQTVASLKRRRIDCVGTRLLSAKLEELQ